MKSKFYEKCHSLIKIKAEKGNSSFINGNKYTILMQQINARKSDEPK